MLLKVYHLPLTTLRIFYLVLHLPKPRVKLPTVGFVFQRTYSVPTLLIRYSFCSNSNGMKIHHALFLTSILPHLNILENPSTVNLSYIFRGCLYVHKEVLNYLIRLTFDKVLGKRLLLLNALTYKSPYENKRNAEKHASGRSNNHPTSSHIRWEYGSTDNNTA